MAAYYNESDPFPAQWLRNLALGEHIAPGHVDQRSIANVSHVDVQDATQAHFFAGTGAWSYALRLAGWPDDRPVWTGSCPCQPFSRAGHKKGIDDDRHLWPEWFRLIRQCRPATIFGEQVASPDGRAWIDVVSADLESLGYAFGAANMCAAGIGAPHVRQRLWFVAHANTDGLQGGADPQQGSPPVRTPAQGGGRPPGDTGATRGFWSPAEWLECDDGPARPVEPGTFPLADGATARVGRLRAYGNAIVPEVAATFIQAATEL